MKAAMLRKEKKRMKKEQKQQAEKLGKDTIQ